MVLLISILFGLTFIYMGFVQNAIMLGVGFILVRMLGQGSLGLVSQTVINQWWMRKRGMVIGISGLIMALLGMGAFPILVYALISAIEWRLAYGILGLSLIIIMAPIGFLLFRNRPDDYQMQPDGMTTETEKENQPAANVALQEENWTLKEAMRGSPGCCCRQPGWRRTHRSHTITLLARVRPAFAGYLVVIGRIAAGNRYCNFVWDHFRLNQWSCPGPRIRCLALIL